MLLGDVISNYFGAAFPVVREKQGQQSGMASDQLSGVHDTSVSVSV